MNKFISLLMVHLLVITIIHAQKTITWNDEQQLTWKDYKMKAPSDHFASALSSLNFLMDGSSKKNDAIIKIETSLSPKQSWVKKNAKSDYLLNHEQVHFDIWEVHARKFRAEVKSKHLTSTNINSTLDRLYQKYYKLAEKAQYRYDKETNHSLKKIQQEQWSEKVSQELKELEDHADITLIIPITM